MTRFNKAEQFFAKIVFYKFNKIFDKIRSFIVKLCQYNLLNVATTEYFKRYYITKCDFKNIIKQCSTLVVIESISLSKRFQAVLG